MLKSSFRQISSYLIAISRKNQARCEPKRRPSQTEPMRNSSSPVSFGYSAHTKPSELPQTAVSGHQARDLRHKTNAPAPRRGFSHRPRNDIRAALALIVAPTLLQPILRAAPVRVVIKAASFYPCVRHLRASLARVYPCGSDRRKAKQREFLTSS